MNNESLIGDGWNMTVDALGGSEKLDRSARETGAFTRARKIGSADTLLRLCFAYGPGDKSLRSGAAWAQASGLADISDVA